MAANRVVMLRAPVTGNFPRASQASQRPLALATSLMLPIPAEGPNCLPESRLRTFIEMLRKSNGPAETKTAWLQEVINVLSSVPASSEPAALSITLQFNVANFVVSIARDSLMDPSARLKPLLSTWEQFSIQQAGLRPNLSRALPTAETKKRKECDAPTNNESPFKKLPSSFGNPRRYRGTGFKRTVLSSQPPATLDHVAWDHSNTAGLDEPLPFAPSPPGSSRASELSDAFYPPPSDTTGTTLSAGCNLFHGMGGIQSNEFSTFIGSETVPHFVPNPRELVQKIVEISGSQKLSRTQKAVENEAVITEDGQLEHNMSSRGDWFGADTMLSSQEEEEDPNGEDDGYWVWDLKVQQFRHWDGERQIMVYCPETFD